MPLEIPHERPLEHLPEEWDGANVNRRNLHQMLLDSGYAQVSKLPVAERRAAEAELERLAGMHPRAGNRAYRHPSSGMYFLVNAFNPESDEVRGLVMLHGRTRYEGRAAIEQLVIHHNFHALDIHGSELHAASVYEPIKLAYGSDEGKTRLDMTPDRHGISSSMRITVVRQDNQDLIAARWNPGGPWPLGRFIGHYSGHAFSGGEITGHGKHAALDARFIEWGGQLRPARSIRMFMHEEPRTRYRFHVVDRMWHNPGAPSEVTALINRLLPLRLASKPIATLPEPTGDEAGKRAISRAEPDGDAGRGLSRVR